ncbi:aminotransferase class III-fold pyridoxal phosphate-dependent enzyme [Collinsella sp. An2]|uniref:aminotransferase class III-fold pyridoxal phosphate-dependent enzyme n=1 Tax=Collinsella sp. An2 TaxID=1965585 RepID=UPI000B38639D|nr:aminotransferase class III-fold pyridoxal phosphate-dependent enzyme [Collinsella sp. An2]OUP07451.1 aspartate aminotransferase family protein [Collinsella sp. An2]
MALTDQLSGEDVKQLHEQYVFQSWGLAGSSAIPVQRAEGIYFWDYDGKRYADMSSLLVCSNLGHNNPELVAALKEQADKMCFMAPAYASAPKSLLAKMLVEVAGADFYQRVFFTNAGADANENAIKMARMVTGRSKILSCYRSYHGATLGASFASGDWRRFASEMGGEAPSFVHFMNPNMYEDGYTRGVDDEAVTAMCLHRLEEQICYENPDNIAAILMESIVGANGVILPPAGYMEGVRALCDKYGILMICDEVMAGFGRTGKMFAWQNFDIKPDLITFAKGVTCGYVPLGGVIASKAVSAYFEDHVLQCGLTYSGHTLACAVGVAALTYYREHKVCEHVKEMEGILKPFLEKMVEKHDCVGEARCIGLFAALTIVKDKKTRELMAPYHARESVMPQIIGELKRRGFSTFGRETNINVCPPLTITADELNEWLPVLDDVLGWADEKFCH